MQTIRPVALCAAILAAASVPVRARAQAATVDQVLGAVAEVVRDRAKRIATRTIARNVRDRLCRGTVKLSLAPDPGERELRLGGEGCWKGESCTPDDVFVRSCRLVTGPLDLPLTDAYYLKSLSRDTIDFLMRIVARRLDARQYREAGLDELGTFMHAILEQLGREHPAPEELAGPTLALADRLSAGMPRRTFTVLGRDAAVEPLASAAASVAARWVKAGCPFAGVERSGKRVSGKACDEAQDDATWFAPEAAQCGAYARSADTRRKVFRTLFAAPSDRRAQGPLFAGRDQPCEEAYPRPRDPGAPDPLGEVRLSCASARVTLNLHDALVKLRCAEQEKREDVVRASLRELGYVVGEQLAYRGAFLGLAEAAAGKSIAPEAVDCAAAAAPADVCKLDAFLDAVAQLDLSDLPREELAYGVRFLGVYAAAVGAAPAATADWIALLRADLDRIRGDPEEAYRALLHGRALGTDAPITSPAVGELSAAAKDLLSLPGLGFRQHQRLRDSAAQGRVSLLHLLRAIQEDPIASRTLPRFVAALADFLVDLAKMTDAAAAELANAPARRGLDAAAVLKEHERALERGRSLLRGSEAIAMGAGAVRLAARRDWVGLAAQVSDELTKRASPGRFDELASAIRFLRVLLSMYQAGTVEEAKAIFASTLEDEGGRERRYADTVIDVAALVGGRGGFEHTRTHGASPETSDGGLYGLFAPFGLQVAKGKWGLLFYPVDLGTYLVATPGAGGPRWPDALRVGLAGYLRLWRETPVVFGLGGDYRPRLDDREESRVFLTAALELPLFTIK